MFHYRPKTTSLPGISEDSSRAFFLFLSAASLTHPLPDICLQVGAAEGGRWCLTAPRGQLVASVGRVPGVSVRLRCYDNNRRGRREGELSRGFSRGQRRPAAKTCNRRTRSLHSQPSTSHRAAKSCPFSEFCTVTRTHERFRCMTDHTHTHTGSGWQDDSPISILWGLEVSGNMA